MRSYIKTIEDLSLNAWPSHQLQIYDGWLLRFSYFYTHRTNSVEQIGPSTIPLDEKIAYCENIYNRWGTPCIFKITPLLDPDFDALLAEQDYQVAHPTEVKVRTLKDFSQEPDTRVDLEKDISWEWLDALFSLKGTNSRIHRRIVPTMYAAIPKDTIAATVIRDDRIVAIGLGILTGTTSGCMPSMWTLFTAASIWPVPSAYASCRRGSARAPGMPISKSSRIIYPPRLCMPAWAFRTSIPTGSA